MSFQPDLVATNIVAALKSEITSNWGRVSTFARRQAKMIAHHAALIAESRVAGTLRTDDDLFQTFVQGLRDMVVSFARTIAAMTIATLQQAWNAIVTTLWDGINQALTGAGLSALPIPTAPKP